MRLVVQRVTGASVTSDGASVGAIGHGLVVLIGVTQADGEADAAALADKVAGLRIFSDEAEKMNRSVADVHGSVLVVSQFTLYGDARRGRRPSFTAAAEPAHAERLIELFCVELAGHGVPVETGRFRTSMQVSLTNDGPVTLILEARGGQVR